MNIKWLNEIHKEGNRFFDSDFEAYEWADGLQSDFSWALIEFPNVGYKTSDLKIVNYLEEFIPRWANDIKIKIHKDTEEIEGKLWYKIWSTRIQERS